MAFLLQIFAPDHINSKEPDIHRIVYVYACRDGRCHADDWKKAWRVLRIQAPLESEESLNNTCTVCGINATKVCGSCKVTKYCSREHQSYHWTNGVHKELCGQALPAGHWLKQESSALSQMKYPEYEIVSEKEIFDIHKDEVEDMGMALTQTSLTQAQSGSLPIAWPEEEFEEANAEVDKTFLKFQKRTRHDPDQVIRYARTQTTQEPSQDNIEPLWVSALSPLTEDVECCPQCKSERTFEFQIMPQLLAYLKLDDTNPYALDFGTMIVYTCSKNCEVKSVNEEAFYRQDFSADGIAMEQRKQRFGMK